MNKVATPDGMINVCLVTQRWAPRFSGAAIRFQQYIPGLRKRGIRVDVVCSTPPGDDSREGRSRWDNLRVGEVLREDPVDGGIVHRVKLPDGSFLRRNTVFNRALAEHFLESRPDVAQFLTLEPLRVPRAACTQRTGVTGVFTGTLLSAFSRSNVKRWLQREWIRRPIQKLDHVIVSSTVMRDFYESLGVTRPISIIPNGVSLERFPTEHAAQERRVARNRLGMPATAHVVLFVGSIIPRKGVDLLLGAFGSVAAADSRAELVLVGPHDDGDGREARGFRVRVDELVRASGAAERIRFVGQVPTVDAYLRAADVLVLPSRHEGMGNVVLEAMAARVPAILTPYLGLPEEFGTPGVEYVLSAAESDCLATHILIVLADPKRREAVARNGRRWVERYMSMSGVIDAYAGVYRDLAVYGRVTTCNRMASWIDRSCTP